VGGVGSGCQRRKMEHALALVLALEPTWLPVASSAAAADHAVLDSPLSLHSPASVLRLRKQELGSLNDDDDDDDAAHRFAAPAAQLLLPSSPPSSLLHVVPQLPVALPRLPVACGVQQQIAAEC
jgi:hypothetical protein